MHVFEILLLLIIKSNDYNDIWLVINVLVGITTIFIDTEYEILRPVRFLYNFSYKNCDSKP